MRQDFQERLYGTQAIKSLTVRRAGRGNGVKTGNPFFLIAL